jgi:tRNA dimethylallyltransferase
LITILGPTACGKTTFAAHLAAKLDAEIISADSRQVYRGMDLGTGKDLEDYCVDGKQIPYHLIDIANPGEKYNVYQFQRDFIIAYRNIIQRGKLPILCGGTGLYIESVLRNYRMSEVPQNPELRAQLDGKSLDELTTILRSYKKLHNTTDVDTAQRAIRAIEIEEYYHSHPEEEDNSTTIPSAHQTLNEIQQNNLVIGLSIDRDLRRQRISQRLQQRLDNGMLDEIRHLLSLGVKSEDLIYYGLEYKYLTLHVIGQLSYQEMFSQLEIAIHQFAKRQMTWFRGMERRGITIHWIDSQLPMQEKIDCVTALLRVGT